MAQPWVVFSEKEEEEEEEI